MYRICKWISEKEFYTCIQLLDFKDAYNFAQPAPLKFGSRTYTRCVYIAEAFSSMVCSQMKLCHVKVSKLDHV